jgi:3-carboxy-cis,cis-muconate cycloisomerase
VTKARAADRLLAPLFTTDTMEAVFSDRGRVQRMLDFEAALARAAARNGLIPAAAAPAIEAKCRGDLFDLDELAHSTAVAGNPAIPLVKQLTTLVTTDDAEAARYVHWGATSQDVLDTALVLQLREALALLEADLARLSNGLKGLADAHRLSVMPGRTFLQHALPTTFGLKIAGWLDAIGRHRARLREIRPRVLVLQFGGATGTLAALGTQGLEVAAALSADLGLALPDLPWHSHRDRVGEVAAVCGLLVGTLGKIARDISLQMQTEVGEAFEPAGPGRGGSSTLPQKRNPVGAMVVSAAATRVPGLVSIMLSAMVQEHERGVGGWHAEWDTLPEILMLAAGALHQLVQATAGLEVDVAQMRRNLDLIQGQILAEAVMMALSGQIGRSAAQQLVERASRTASAQKRHLRSVLAEDPQVNANLSGTDLDRLFDPGSYLGVAQTLIDRVLAATSLTSSAGEERT